MFDRLYLYIHNVSAPFPVTFTSHSFNAHLISKAPSRADIPAIMRLFTIPLSLLLAFVLVKISPATAQTASSAAPSAKSAGHPVMGAVGIGVADMARAQKFYTEVLGLKDTGQRYNTPLFDEVILSMPYPSSGSAIVLMKWKTPKNVTNLPIKLVFYVDDMKATFDKIRKDGREITMEPGTGKLNNVSIVTGFAKDPDGYLLEFNPLTFLPKSSTSPKSGT